MFMKLFQKHSYRIISSLLVVFSLPTTIYADGITCEPGTICPPIPYKTIPEFIQVILIGVIKIGIPIIALALIYSGFLFVAAQGNSEKLETAKKSLLYTIIGAAILLGAWAIAILISETVLGIS
ncbi:MAG: hypothetical protein KBC06_00705 [Candidatus Pacebacteria bacterium]|nr:hypothetical protein [Candidatus Paceibacterota bacterium]